MSNRRGDVLDGRYRLQSIAGHGGMATVFRAKDLRHDRPVAVKILRQGLPVSAVDGFLQEIRVTARFHHPHILPMLDSGTVRGVPYFVMPFVRCRSLRHRLEREGPLSWDRARAIVAEVADALGYAHREGVIHLDIKPENILLSEGHAYITDFGIARALCGRTEEDPYAVMGTLEYMSPEQAVGDTDLDARSDVYSLAAVIHEILTGATPLRGATPGEVLSHHLHGPAFPTLHHEALGTRMTAVLEQALDRRPDRRPATPPALFHALDHAEAKASPGGAPLDGREAKSLGWPARLLGPLLHG